MTTFGEELRMEDVKCFGQRCAVLPNLFEMRKLGSNIYAFSPKITPNHENWKIARAKQQNSYPIRFDALHG